MPSALPSHSIPARERQGPPSSRLRSALTLLALVSTAVLASAETSDLPDGSRIRITPLAHVTTGKPATAGFTRLPTSALPFTNRLSEVFALNNQILENGAGVALADVNADGHCDVYLCGSENDNALFLNLGNGSFTNDTANSVIACPGDFSTGAAFADVDGDQDPDLLVNGLGVGTRLFLNDGKGHFTESNQSGLRRNGAATSMALADLDGDGDLDLYVCQYRTSSIRGEDQPPAVSARIVEGRAVVTPADRFIGFPRPDGTVELAEKGEPDRLYWNDGKGHFSLVSWTQGNFTDENGRTLRNPPEDWGLSVSLRDLNGDSHPDIYVCNDFFRSRDRVWLGDGLGHFRAAGADVLRGFPLSSMSIDGADLDRDGHDDFLVAEMLSRNHAHRRIQRANAPKPGLVLPLLDPAYQIEHPRNVLLHARGDGSFADIAWYSGLAATDWTWNVACLDVDLDGWEDVLFATGNAHDVLDMDAQDRIDRAGRNRTSPLLGFYPPLAQPNLAFRNNRDLTFTDSSEAWGFHHAGVSQGLALADLDGDGDLDAVLNNLNQQAWLYRNDATAPRIAIRLHGPVPNSSGTGARIVVSAPADAGVPDRQSQVIVAGGRYLSSDDPIRTFACGSAAMVRVEVEWPDGRRSIVDQVPANHLCEVFAPAGKATPGSRPARFQPLIRTNRWFVPVALPDALTHAAPPADPALDQPLIPARLDVNAPGIGWADADGDGWDDLGLFESAGIAATTFRNNARGGFEPTPSPELRTTVPASHPPLPPDPLGPGTRVGPVALADVDGDGDLDVFAGGRLIIGRWPEPASSRLFINANGMLLPAPASSNSWTALGLVQGAVFADLDDDGDPDLAISCEWGPIRLFRNHRGQFTEWIPAVSGLIPGRGATPAPLSLAVGRWTGIATGDFDADGHLDLVVGNWGRNAREHASLQYELWYGDLTGTGAVAVLETVLDPASGRRMPWRARDEVIQAFPWVPERFESYRAFAAADTAQLLAGRPSSPIRIPLVVSDSVVLLARGDRFEARSLPREAQFAPTFGIAVADFNGDGQHDVCLAQNFFATEPETPRLDAGLGLILAGNGDGSFRAVPAAESGVRILGEQRGVAVSDFDHDGRIDLAVGVRNGQPHVLRNQSGPIGWRFQLVGPKANPRAVGARLRLRAGDHVGPVLELHAGHGWLSQDSSTPLLHSGNTPTELEVRWPNGPTTRHPVPPTPPARPIQISVPGSNP